jgi:hypothetical protein
VVTREEITRMAARCITLERWNRWSGLNAVMLAAHTTIGLGSWAVLLGLVRSLDWNMGERSRAL